MDCVRRRGKVYCVVVTVPLDLVVLMGRRQIWRSLKTKNYDIARTQSRKLLLTMEQLFQEVRTSMDSRLINGMVAEYGLRWLRDTDKARLGVRVSNNEAYNAFMLHRAECQRSSDGSTDEVAKGMTTLAGEFQRDEGRGHHLNIPYATELADQYLTLFNKRGLVGKPEELKEGDFKEVAAAFATAERQLYKAEAERMQGIIEEDSTFQYRLLEKWNRDKIVPKDVGIPLPALLEEYGAQWKNSNASKEGRKRKELDRIEESFRECFGKDLGVKEIDDEKALEWRNYLQYEYHSDRDLVMANKAVDNYTETASAVFNWAAGGKHKRAVCNTQKPLIKYVDQNPFRALGLPKGIISEQSRIFSAVELQQYMDALADNYNPDEPEMTFIPLIMQYSGMRCNEVAQLYLDDVQQIEGTSAYYLQIQEDQERKQRIKCSASHRGIPVHKELIELGLLKYVQRMRDAGEVQLFPNCKYRESTGYYYSDAMSSRLNSLINIHVSSDRKLRLYSLRANFRTAIVERITSNNVAAILAGGTAENGILERVIDEIMGHAVKGSTGKKRYTKLDILTRAQVMELLYYPIDLSRLKTLLT